MEINVFIERINKREIVNLDEGSVKELLTKLDVNKGSVIITRDNEVITENSELKDKDKIELLSVISGG